MTNEKIAMIQEKLNKLNAKRKEFENQVTKELREQIPQLKEELKIAIDEF